MPRTCSRMKVSASPKPASGPVRGLTWPILIARDCALAGMTRSTAGAATAPRPTLTIVRRDGRDVNSVMLTSLDWNFLIPAARLPFGADRIVIAFIGKRTDSHVMPEYGIEDLRRFPRRGARDRAMPALSFPNRPPTAARPRPHLPHT